MTRRSAWWLWGLAAVAAAVLGLLAGAQVDRSRTAAGKRHLASDAAPDRRVRAHGAYAVARFTTARSRRASDAGVLRLHALPGCVPDDARHARAGEKPAALPDLQRAVRQRRSGARHARRARLLRPRLRPGLHRRDRRCARTSPDRAAIRRRGRARRSARRGLHDGSLGGGLPARSTRPDRGRVHAAF